MRKPRCIAAVMALLLAVTASGCSQQEGDTLTPEARTTLYQAAIEGARPQEENDAFDILTGPEDDFADVIFSMLGVVPEDMTAYAISVSPANIQAYGIAIIYPAKGREDTVYSGLSNFVTRQKQSFERYLADQYEIASNAKMETLEDGTLVLVMCNGQDAIFDAIKASIETP
ncbi:MAG: DUF4358 domain-containing protein [Oscillospiraceae bacterium]|nr:DUF4358 domain-containing protein [Oscillospiraceae bacterium]